MIEHLATCPVNTGGLCSCGAVRTTGVPPSKAANEVRWVIPRQVWIVLVSWGLALILMSGLLALWITRNAEQAERERAEAKAIQDRDMCVTLDLFWAGPPPPPGPTGDWRRTVLAQIERQQANLKCDDLRARPAREAS